MGILIGIFSAKGGVGKSILAVNLAASLADALKQSTALIDLNPGLGCTDLLLDLKSEKSWGDLKGVMGELTEEHINLAVSIHPTGLNLLTSPTSIAAGTNLDHQEIRSLLAVFRKKYDYVLLDTSTGLEAIANLVYSLVDFRLIVLTPDGPTLRATSRYLESKTQNKGRAGLVINQFTPAAAITPKEIKKYLKINILSVLPMDPASVWKNVSYGSPCVLQKRSKLGKSIRQLSIALLRISAGSNHADKD